MYAGVGHGRERLETERLSGIGRAWRRDGDAGGWGSSQQAIRAKSEETSEERQDCEENHKIRSSVEKRAALVRNAAGRESN
jgi:hypothetical protein